ncbi:MAG: hypothetical protein BroJett018_40290 [Chloroflexota bacterium]|nr:MAG: hypothetical protein BroJett018_40290 [Chloroflexota bacterium]
MKISIWQQFSSNHSAHFTLVGLFETPADAQNVAGNIRKILNLIAAWHDANPQESERIFDDPWIETAPISPPEQAVAAEYHIKWNPPILWFRNYDLQVYDRFLCIHDTRNPDAGPYPIYELINRLGGHAYVRGDLWPLTGESTFRLKLSCDVPDEAIANKIIAEFGGRLTDTHTLELLIGGEDDDLNSFEYLPQVFEKLKSYGCQNLECVTLEGHPFRIKLDDEI